MTKQEIADFVYQIAMQDRPLSIQQVMALCGLLGINYPPEAV